LGSARLAVNENEPARAASARSPRPCFPFEKTGGKEVTDTQRTPYVFTGKELDEESGLCCVGAGYHDPRTDAFPSTHPLPSRPPRSWSAGRRRPRRSRPS